LFPSVIKVDTKTSFFQNSELQREVQKHTPHEMYVCVLEHAFAATKISALGFFVVVAVLLTGV